METRSSVVPTPTAPVTSSKVGAAVWKKRVGSPSPELVRVFGSPMLAELLSVRGITSIEAAQRFLNPRYEYLRAFGGGVAPRGLDRAVERLVPALRSKEKIIIFGDYDVDGVCGSAIMADGLRGLGGIVEPVLPHRERDGYGLQLGSVPGLLARKPGLVVTVDNGIQSHAAVAALRSAKIDVIIVDHHEPGPELPAANVVVNPKQAGDTADFRQLCAAGLAFRVVEALHDRLAVPDGQEKWFLDLAALATVCDMVPLKEDNRMLVHFGLKTLAKSRRLGLRELTTRSSRGEPLSAETLGFRLGPRLNAAGRLEHAQRALDLLLSSSPAQAAQLCEFLDQLNRERQQLTKRVATDALRIASEHLDAPALVLTNPDWPKGVCGLAASKVAEKLNRPVFILEEGALCVGSGRSVPGVNLAQAIESMRPLFVKAGGHAAAAGCTIALENLDAFRTGLVEFSRKARGSSVPPAVLEYDSEILLSQVDLPLLDLQAQLEPFGVANPKPLVKLSGLKVSRMRLVGADQQHVSLVLEQGREQRRAIAFGQADQLGALGPGATIDALAQVRQNDWGGRKSAELQILATMVR